MFCLRNLRKCCVSSQLRLVQKAKYSRRNSNDTRVVVLNFGQEPYKNLENSTVTEYDPNWELLIPAGYRFYLPGSIGHGWSDAGSTVRMEFQNVLLSDINDSEYTTIDASQGVKKIMQWEVTECPKLLRKDIKELFPAWVEVMFPEMTIVTIILKPRVKNVRWSTVTEHEDLAKSFVLSASYVCNQLRLARHWADFINPFSGKPHIGQQKVTGTAPVSNDLNRTNFKIEVNNNCKIISQKKVGNSFIGCLYTTAPSNNLLLQELMYDISED